MKRAVDTSDEEDTRDFVPRKSKPTTTPTSPSGSPTKEATQDDKRKSNDQRYTDDQLRALWKRIQQNCKTHSNADEVIPFSDCLLFQGTKDNYGYGILREHFGQKGLTLPGSGEGIQLQVHRIAFFIRHGYRRVPTGLVASHLCHRKNCVNGQHLVAETRAENLIRTGCPHSFRADDGEAYRVCTHASRLAPKTKDPVERPFCLRRDTDNLADSYAPQKMYSQRMLCHTSE